MGSETAAAQQQAPVGAPRSGLPALALAALGVVYGDIGTNPLYTIKEVFTSVHHPLPVTPDNVLGILSLVFWSLMNTPIERTWYVVYHPDRWLPPAASAFRDFLLDEGARKVEAETRRLLAEAPEPR